MKLVKWTDERGRNHEALVREKDTEQDAKEGRGVSRDPPDVDLLDWDAIKRDLHNKLLATGVTSLAEVHKQQTGLRSAVTSAIVPKLLELFRNGG